MSCKKVYMAIDAHARNCVQGFMDARGEFQRTWRFKTCERQLVEHIKLVEAGTKLMAVEEGPLAYWIARTIRPHVTDVLIADPRENPLISRNAMKGDKVDVRQLCRLLRMGELKRVYHPEDDDRAVFKSAVQQYIDFRNRQTALKQKIKAKFRGWGVHDIDGSRIYNPDNREEFLELVEQPPLRNQLLRLFICLDETVRLQKSALEEAWSLGTKYPEIREFIKLPGVGRVGALVYDAYIQTPHRFSHKSRLFRYCKLGIKDRSSDGKPLGFQKLDNKGNSELKAMSYRAFTSAMKGENEVSEFHMNSLVATHSNTHARLNTQRKIISVMHGIWRKGEEYNPDMFLGSE